MGFHCTFHAVSDNVLNGLVEHPNWVLPYLYGPNDEDAGFAKDDFNGEEPPLWTKAWNEDVRGWIEQTWGGINLLMTGDPKIDEFPEGFLIHGGVSLLPDADCRGFLSNEVQVINQYLNDFDRKTLCDNFNIETLKKEVYPFGRWPGIFDKPENLLPELLNEFEMLKTSINSIAENKMGMIIIIA